MPWNERKEIRRARVPLEYPPRGPYPSPTPMDCLVFYQYSSGFARELAQYCAIDEFLAKPALRMLERHLPARLFDAQAEPGERFVGFAHGVIRYDYEWRDARAIFITLTEVLSFVRVAADAEEIASMLAA